MDRYTSRHRPEDRDRGATRSTHMPNEVLDLREASRAADSIFDRSRGESIGLNKTINYIGSSRSISFFSDADHTDMGTLTIAPQDGSMRIGWIHNKQRARYKGLGTAMIKIADRFRALDNLRSLTLRSQSEDASVFFYKSGFRFTGEGMEAKNSAMRRQISNPEFQPPDDVIFLGEMERG
ncbi:hypothetical protein [Mesorhizobium argentiipisi]|uniref:N-acetyltransferase domain-containing protein n=1 Tax=Mesorhizobium argentiipisi TaxID=3015175 RepID=A0ABU8K7X1_9HYPH